MFDELDLIKHWHISRKTLARFILMVRRGYRDPAYHNWMHAFSVCHFIYVCGMNLPLAGDNLTHMEFFALFVASLCHDIDHRGTNNSFQVSDLVTKLWFGEFIIRSFLSSDHEIFVLLPSVCLRFILICLSSNIMLSQENLFRSPNVYHRRGLSQV